MSRMRPILTTVGITVLCLCLVTVMSGCSASGSEPSGSTITVAASFYPLADLAEGIGGDCVDVTNLTPPGVEPHDLELTPSDVETIATSDVVLYLGEGFQPAVE